MDGIKPVDGGSQQTVSLPLQLPAGQCYLLHRYETVALQPEESALCTYVGVVAQCLYAAHLSAQSFLGSEVCVDRWDGHGEDAVVRGSPKQSVPVVCQLGHIVGAEPIVLTHA